MNLFTRLAHSASTVLMKNRHRLPRFLNRLIDDVAKNPDGLASRVASFVLGGSSAKHVPAPTSAPDADVRVYIGPTNYSGQGFLWARALEQDDTGIAARNMAVELPGGFAFPADTLVPVGVYNTSRTWQEAELKAVEGFTHVLFEAERPLFGSLLGRDVAREIETLQSKGISCAFLCHGTDIRSPRDHARRNRWSPFSDDSEQTRRLQADADANLALLAAHDLPVFVSTPDLLFDVPDATWCPVVVDPEVWAGGRSLFECPLPVVVHIPSMGPVKGTELIEPALRALHASGVIEYRSVTGVPAARMPALIGDADIVLDQFRIGSYGVAAVEAMAAGRVVIGHILPEVRAKVRKLASIDLPIIEADPSSLRDIILGVVASPEHARKTASAGEDFVRSVHAGRRSAHALRSKWIDAG